MTRGSGHRSAAPARHAEGGAGREIGLIVLVFVVGGLAGGLVWRWLWTPFKGTVLAGVWYPDVNHSAFAGTGSFVLIGLVLGLLLGAGSALLTERRELLTLVLVSLAALLAGWLMLQVGHLGMPEDPSVLARSVGDRKRLPATLDVRGWTPLAALPVGALVGVFAVFMGLTRKTGDTTTGGSTDG